MPRESLLGSLLLILCSISGRRIAVSTAVVLLATACADSPTATDADPSFHVGGQNVSVVVTLDETFAESGIPVSGVAHSRNKDRAAELAGQMGVSATRTYGTALFGFAANVPEGRIEALRRDPRVRSVELDGMASAPDSWTRAPVFQRGPASNGRGGNPGKPPPEPEPDPCADEPAQVEGWGRVRVGGVGDGTGKTVWILDSGIDFASCDLNVDVDRSANFIFDYVTGRGKKAQPADARDMNGHGTAVASVVAAIDNEIGAVGIAAGATVVPVRVLGINARGAWSAIAEGIDYVAASAAPGDIANMSIGGTTHQDFVDTAVQNAADLGIVFTISAGNRSLDAGIELYEPAHNEHTNIYTVSAIDSIDALTSFSNFGSPVDFAAPGLDITVYRLGGGVVSSAYGTSFAAPMVAGILTLQGFVGTDGFATGDPDGVPDPIAHR